MDAIVSCSDPMMAFEIPGSISRGLFTINCEVRNGKPFVMMYVMSPTSGTTAIVAVANMIPRIKRSARLRRASRPEGALTRSAAVNRSTLTMPAPLRAPHGERGDE